MTIITHAPTDSKKPKILHSAKPSAANMLINDTYGEQCSLRLVQECNHQYKEIYTKFSYLLHYFSNT